MIAKIGRGQKLGGLLVYLLGEGEHNEHEHRHLIAGSPSVMRADWMVDFHGPEAKRAARDIALEIAREIDLPRKLYGTAVRMKAKPVAVGARGHGVDVVERPGKGEAGVMRDAPNWHCVLAAMPGEELSDEVWAQITHTFMDEMGFSATPDAKRAQARWGAVRHGRSGEHGDGQDHVHIAASLVREDGSKVSTFDYGPGKAKGDWSRAEEVCVLIEQQYGLKVRASRKEGGELSANSRAEIERMARDQGAETERERLRRMVRAAAVSADSEVAFVRELRDAGISVVPRWAAGGKTDVVGYSVRLRHGNTEAGPWCGGGTLAKDLNLNALREQQWEDSPESRAAAVAAWLSPKTTGERARRGLDEAELWQQAATQFGQWHQHLGEIPRTDRARWAWAAGQAAGVFAAWSEKLEGEQPGALAAAAQELTRSAQLPKGERRYRPSSTEKHLGDLAKLLMSGGSTRAESHGRESVDVTAAVSAAVLAALLLLLLAAIAILLEVARAHRARGELGRAVALEGVSTTRLSPLSKRWEAQIDERRGHEDRDIRDIGVTPTPERHTDIAAAKTSKLSEMLNKAAAAASAPLTPPSASNARKPARPRRVFYSEMTAEQKTLMRVKATTDAQFAFRDLNVRALSDEDLAQELAERRAEFGMLVRDLDERKIEGPRTRQAKADNAELARKADAIEPALQADQAASELTRAEKYLYAELAKLDTAIEETPRRKLLARKALQDRAERAETELAEVRPQAEQARGEAEAAAKATGSPQHEWNEILRESTPARERHRLEKAKEQDRNEFVEDRGYLRDLQRTLDRVEAESERRERLTPEQRAADQRRARTAPKGPKKSTETGYKMPYQPPPDLGRGRDSGPSL
ncbi:relaxase/mobilization nuclease domain-containing protein [Nocardia sp. NPDC059195]|uniref:relaxase/mobilization nuclease domain-containing protein n=1 Tax=Nocardia sp. NPDC059195 TaxID=3346765 RepID=UPI00369A7E2E